MLPWFNNTGKVFFPIVALSGNIIDELYEHRINIYNELKEKNINITENIWPYCEVFVASAILSKNNCKIINLDDYYQTKGFNFMNHKYIYDKTLYEQNAIFHPVVGKEFIEKNLLVNDITTLFKKDSSLYNGINSMDPIEFISILEKYIKLKKDFNLLNYFWNFALQEGWINTPHIINYAFAKPALQSSTCSFSTYKDLEKDASLLVDGFLDHKSKSCTDFEMNPWVQVDLINLIYIKNILIYVRPENFHIFTNFKILFSKDGEVWNTVFLKNDNISLDSANMKPIVINFLKEEDTRFIKVVLLDTERLHLNQIEVYSY